MGLDVCQPWYQPPQMWELVEDRRMTVEFLIRVARSDGFQIKQARLNLFRAIHQNFFCQLTFKIY